MGMKKSAGTPMALKLVLLLGLPAALAVAAWWQLRRSDPPATSAQPTPDMKRPEVARAARAVRSHRAIPHLLELGCIDPAVNDDETLALVVDAAKPGVVIPTVFCKTRNGTPSCEEVARAYAPNANVTTPYFYAVVLSAETGAVLCQERFSPDGTPRAAQ